MAAVNVGIDVSVLASLLAEQHHEVLMLRAQLHQLRAAYAELEERVQPPGMGAPVAMVTKRTVPSDPEKHEAS